MWRCSSRETLAMPALKPGIVSSEAKKSSMKCWPGWARRALDDQVVERDRLRVLGQRAVLAQFLGHHVEAVEDAAVAPVELGQGGGERLLDRVAADADHLLEEAVEEDRVADLVDLLGGEEVGLLLGRGGGDVGGEGVGDAVLAVEEHRVDPHRRAPLDVAEAVPAGFVAGEVDVVGAPVALLPALVEVLVGDVVHQALRCDAHLSPLLVYCGQLLGEVTAKLAAQPGSAQGEFVTQTREFRSRA